LIVPDPQGGPDRRLLLSCETGAEPGSPASFPAPASDQTWQARLSVTAPAESRTCEESGQGLPIRIRCEVEGGAVALETGEGAAATDVPAPEECRATPRDLATLQDLAEEAAALPLASPIALPAGGEAVGDETVAAITATVREALACFNAGAYLQAFALYSDGYFVRLFAAVGPYDQSVLDFLAAAPVPRAEEERLALLGVRETRRLAAGRVGAVVEVADPTTPGVEGRSFVIFVQANGRWLIDDVVPLASEGTPVAGRAEPGAAGAGTPSVLRPSGA
jgi:hypothetical protein